MSHCPPTNGPKAPAGGRNDWKFCLPVDQERGGLEYERRQAMSYSRAKRSLLFPIRDGPSSRIMLEEKPAGSTDNSLSTIHNQNKIRTTHDQDLGPHTSSNVQKGHVGPWAKLRPGTHPSRLPPAAPFAQDSGRADLTMKPRKCFCADT